MKKHLTVSIFAIAVSALMLFSSCAQNDAQSSVSPVSEESMSNTSSGVESGVSEEPAGESATETEIQTEFDSLELREWNGTWNSMYGLLSAPEFEEAYPKLAEQYDEPMTPEAVKENYETSYKTDFLAMVVDGDTIKFYDQAAAIDGSLAGDPIYTGTYHAEGNSPVIGEGYSYAWYQFKADEEGPYQYIVMLPPESAEEEGFAHWHYRVGNESFDALLQMEEWWATSILPETTAGNVVEIFTAEDDA